MIQQLLSDRCFDYILLLIQPQNLDRIGIAVEEQADQLIEWVDHRVRCRILILLKIGQADQIRRQIQRNSAEIYITPFTIRTIAVASAYAQEHNSDAKSGVGVEKCVFFCAQ